MKQSSQGTRCRPSRKDLETSINLWRLVRSTHPTCIFIVIMLLRLLYYNIRHMHSVDKVKVPPYKECDITKVIANDKIKILWDFPFSVTTKLSGNEPDMILMIKRQRICMRLRIQISCSSERNIVVKEVGKLDKYRNLIL